jgi:phage gpG-like protein
MSIPNNIDDVIKAIQARGNKIDDVAKQATRVVGQMAVREIKSQIQGKRTYTTRTRTRDTSKVAKGSDKLRLHGGPKGSKYRVYDKATSNQPPKNRTGKLKNSVRANAPEGFNGRYTVIVGPYAEYARVLELGGNPHWPSGLKFPFVEPASKIISTKARQVYVDALRKALF